MGNVYAGSHTKHNCKEYFKKHIYSSIPFAFFMEKEFIAETRSGSLYHVTYKKHFFEHNSRFSCRQLFGKTVDFGKDVVGVDGFRGKKKVFLREEMDLKHFKNGIQLILMNGNNTSPIAKIFERID